MAKENNNNNLNNLQNSWDQNKPGDKEAGFELSDDFERFGQRNDMFNRSWWDKDVMSEDAKDFFKGHITSAFKRGPGFMQKDFALRNASWAVADDYADRNADKGLREGFLDPLEAREGSAETQVDFPSIAEATTEIKAIPTGPPSFDRPNKSSIAGIKKWTADCEKCFGYWAKMKSDCAICMRVCPFNKDYSKWYMRTARKLAGTRLRHVMLWLDIKLGFGQRVKPQNWWSRSNSNS